MSQEQGYLCLILHAHLPFVRHPEHEDFLEEDWLYEAITETYIPLIDMFENLTRDNTDFRLTMSITPPLANMFSDALLQKRYKRHLGKLIEFIEKEVARLKDSGEFLPAAKMYERKLKRAREIYVDHYDCNLINAFRKFQDMGKLEIITCPATHGFLPLMLNEKSVRIQIRVGVRDYIEKFGRKPSGIWLSECAYYPGIDKILKEEGLRYFILDTHGIIYGKPRPKYAVYAPVYCPSGVAAFGRDTESSHQVWSQEIGYPGDYRYREFYRDTGYDLDYEYVKPYLHADGVRRNMGIKYHKISGADVALDKKQAYWPDDAREAAAQHAGNFMFNREKQIEWLAGAFDRKPIIVSPYDAELFGHWWYEGPEFLDFLFRKLYHDQKTVGLITPSEYLRTYPKNQVITPAASSWGDKGYYEVWLNGTNDWIYRHLHKAEERMEELAGKYFQAQGITQRALNQAARELLLAQSSDWAFIMTTGTMTAYAEKRTKNHLNAFNTLYCQIKNNTLDGNYVSELEHRNNIFPSIDYRDWR